ncbi:MAG: acyltransferase family protein [Desulfobacteraceae bacterium]|nr:acyltransferase family protein [Desulfobacteraceae bacterium]
MLVLFPRPIVYRSQGQWFGMMDSVGTVSPSKSNRVEWIDTLKGIGIFLVFFGHVSFTDKSVVKYIFSFHMPLFFFISGMFFKYSDVRKGFRQFFVKKVRSRLIPYACFGLLTYCIWLFPMLLKKYGVYQGLQPVPESLVRPLVGMLYGNGFDDWLVHNILLWFLACLVVTEFLFYLVARLVHDRTLPMLLVIMLFQMIGYFDSIYSTVRLPFGIDVAFTAVAFYGMGYILKDRMHPSGNTVYLAVVCFVIGLIACNANDRVDMNENRHGNIILFHIASFSSIYAWLHIARLVGGIKYLRHASYIGENSLIFSMLQNQGFLAANILMYLALGLRPGSLETNSLHASVYALLSMVSLVLPTYLIANYTPFFLGRTISGSNRPSCCKLPSL